MSISWMVPKKRCVLPNAFIQGKMEYYRNTGNQHKWGLNASKWGLDQLTRALNITYPSEMIRHEHFIGKMKFALERQCMGPQACNM